jgi:hypothetical protein
MAGQVEPTNPKPMFEPGELDKTRKNIGNVDPVEAKILTQKLGGEIGVERSSPQTARNTAPLVKRAAAPAKQEAGVLRTSERPGAATRPQTKVVSVLPKISKTKQNKMDKLMRSDEYRIKMNFGIFTSLVLLIIGKSDNVLPTFIRVAMGNTISHMDALAACVHQLQNAVPESYQKKMQESENTKFKMLRKIASWSISDIRPQHEKLKTGTRPVTVTMLIPITKSLYKYLLSVYFLGEQRGANMIQSILSDIAAYPDLNTSEIVPLVRQMVVEWEYLFKNSVRRMYPLLMRMCSTQYYTYPEFFTKEIANILTFLGMTKYDLVLPQKNTDAQGEAADDKTVAAATNSGESAETAAQKETFTAEQEKKQRLIETGLKLLDQLFPGAGWFELPNNKAIDFFPYFQPLFSFSDGFALLAPENPVQKIVVLNFILEDLFRGCRSIKFVVDTDADPRMQAKGDSLALVLDEWRVYQDLVFEKRYAADLKDLVEHLYTREGFIHSPLGKKMIFSLLWQTKFFYLPHFTFSALGKPQYEFAYRPLCARVSFLQNIFSVLSERIDAAAKTRTELAGIRNPWDNYIFDIPNEVSRRLDALSRVQKNSILTTNANIVKSVATTLSVFDWWINDASSPAYIGSENMQIYRTAGSVGSMPVTPPKVRDDQTILFQQQLKKIEQARKTGQAMRKLDTV